MSPKLVNLFHSRADNIGDRMCGPAQYLWPNKVVSLPLARGLPGHISAAILGGGQIFSQLREVLSARNASDQAISLIAWGVGLPIHGTQDKEVRRVASGFTTFSTRNYDWREDIEFVPCPSCLSTAFNFCREPTHEVVIYNHRKKPGAKNVPDGIPVLSNSVSDPAAAVEFIASGDIVVTSSYHGVYWAQLLGRRVVCLPYNQKFSTFESPPSFAEPETWASSLKFARRSRPLLEEYRSLNMAYAKKVELALQ